MEGNGINVVFSSSEVVIQDSSANQISTMSHGLTIRVYDAIHMD